MKSKHGLVRINPQNNGFPWILRLALNSIELGNLSSLTLAGLCLIGLKNMVGESAHSLNGFCLRKSTTCLERRGESTQMELRYWAQLFLNGEPKSKRTGFCYLWPKEKKYGLKAGQNLIREVISQALPLWHLKMEKITF